MELNKMKLVLDDDESSYKTNEKSVVIVDKNGNVLSHHVIHNNEKIEIKRDLTEKQKYKIKQNKDIKDFIECNEGSFIHNLYKYCYPYMLDLQELDEGSKSNIHIIRFIVLSTYLSKDGYVRYQNRKIKKSRLIRIWNLKNSRDPKKTYDRLKNIGYIIEDSEGYIMINQDVMKNGKIIDFNKIKNKNDNYTYTRLFSKNIQDMYCNCKERDRGKLAILFKLLPFVNFKYNVFCYNPTETIEENINLCNWKDLARICGYDDSNSSRIKKDLWNLKIYDSSVVGIFATKTGNAICINPKVYYGGNDIKDVKHLYAMFKMCENSEKG